MAEVRLTAEGIAQYEERLEYLKTVRRMEIAELIKLARPYCLQKHHYYRKICH